MVFATLCCAPIHAFCSLPIAVSPLHPISAPLHPEMGRAGEGPQQSPAPEQCGHSAHGRGGTAPVPGLGHLVPNCALIMPARVGARWTLGHGKHGRLGQRQPQDGTAPVPCTRLRPFPGARGSRAFVPGPLSGICSLRRRQHQTTDWSHFGAPAATRAPLGRTQLEYLMASSPPSWQWQGSCS